MISRCGSNRLCSISSRLNHNEISGVDKECLDALKPYPRSGNVRQLRNVMERASVLCRASVINIGDLAAEFKTRGQRETALFQIRLGTSMEDVERELILKPIDFAERNKTRAAEILGVTPRPSIIAWSATPPPPTPSGCFAGPYPLHTSNCVQKPRPPGDKGLSWRTRGRWCASEYCCAAWR
jgi:hypothetical protein